MTGEVEGRPGGKSRLAREFRLFGTIGVLVVLVFGAIQIWQISFSTHTAPLTITPEVDPISADDSAVWLLGLLEVEVQRQDDEEPLLVLPAGTTEGAVTVRGRSARQAIIDGRVGAVARVPGSVDPALSVDLPLLPDDDGLVFQLSMAAARDFQNRMIETQVAFRDIQGVMARGLFPGGAEELAELPDRRGVYRLGLYADQLLLALQRGDAAVTIQPRDGFEPPLPDVDIQVDWFLHDAQESRVVTLPVDLSERGRAAEPEPVAAPEEVARPAEETPPAPDPEVLRQQRLAQLTRQVDDALERGAWDRAETLARQAQGQGAAASTIRGWRDSIAEGRREADRVQQVNTLATAIGTALQARDWDAAERDVAALRGLAPDEPRLPVWDQAIRDGRAADLAAQQAEDDAARQAAAPPPEPAPDPKARIRSAVDDYARAQSTRDLALYTEVYPGSTEQQRRTIQQAWANEAERDFRLTVESIEVDGDEAVVAARQSLTIKPLAGERRTIPTSRIQLRMACQDDRWFIVAIEAR